MMSRFAPALLLFGISLLIAQPARVAIGTEVFDYVGVPDDTLGALGWD